MACRGEATLVAPAATARQFYHPDSPLCAQRKAELFEAAAAKL
jgi:hypothetical protein